MQELKDKLVGKFVSTHQMQGPAEDIRDFEGKFKTLLKFMSKHKDMFTQVSDLSECQEWQNVQQMLLDNPTDLDLADPLISMEVEKSSDNILAENWAIIPFGEVKTLVQEKSVTPDAQCIEGNIIGTQANISARDD